MGENRPPISPAKLAVGLAMKLRAALEKRLGYNFRGNDTFLQASSAWLIIVCFIWLFADRLSADVVRANEAV